MLGALENSQKSLAMSTSHIRAAYITIRSYGFYRGVIITVGKVSKMEGPENTVRTVQITEKRGTYKESVTTIFSYVKVPEWTSILALQDLLH